MDDEATSRLTRTDCTRKCALGLRAPLTRAIKQMENHQPKIKYRIGAMDHVIEKDAVAGSKRIGGGGVGGGGGGSGGGGGLGSGVQGHTGDLEEGPEQAEGQQKKGPEDEADAEDEEDEEAKKERRAEHMKKASIEYQVLSSSSHSSPLPCDDRDSC